MANEPWAPEAPGGGKAPKPLHHHVLEEHLGGVVLVIDEKDKNMLWSDLLLYDLSNSIFFKSMYHVTWFMCHAIFLQMILLWIIKSFFESDKMSGTPSTI